MTHYCAVVAYDGTDFAGFQVQRDVRTVQGDLEAALARLNDGQPVRVRGAGRTDAGAHAVGQTIDFVLDWHHPDDELHRALNAIVSDDIAIRRLGRAPDEFHPRFSATSRVYRYTIWNCPIRSPRARRWALHEPRRLDHGAMDAALQRLVGRHDFASFGRPPQGNVTVRNVLHAGVRRYGPWIFIDVEANAFLYRMVRRIVGTVLIIGRGDAEVAWSAEVLAARDPGTAGTTVAPHGLCLITVRYDGVQGLFEDDGEIACGSEQWSIFDEGLLLSVSM